MSLLKSVKAKRLFIDSILYINYNLCKWTVFYFFRDKFPYFDSKIYNL